MSSHGNAASSNSSSPPALKTTKPSTNAVAAAATAYSGASAVGTATVERDQDDPGPLGAANPDARGHFTTALRDSGLV